MISYKSVFTFTLFIFTSLLSAQNNQEVVIETQQLSEHVYMLTGQGGNIGVCVGDQGIFQITDGTGANTDTKIVMGVVASDYGWIQAVKPGTNVFDLALQPNGGKVGIGTSSPTGNLTIANPTAYAPNTISAANSYIQLGSTDYGSGGSSSDDGKFMIGFGYTDGLANTNSPAYIGFEETSTSGDTKGDLTFYTRNVVTDTQPTKRMTISDDGYVGIGTDAPDASVKTYHSNLRLAVPVDIFIK